MSDMIVYKNAPRCDPSLLSWLADFGVADLHEAQIPTQRAFSLMGPAMRPVVQGARIVGQAVTAATVPGDNLILYAALDIIEQGQVLVMSNGGIPSGALFGDVSGSFALHRGVAGVIVDGPVRDVCSLREMNFPLWSTSISVSHPEKNGPGTVNQSISCAGCIVNPGDIIVADDDGVLVLRPDEIEAVLSAATERQHREAGYRRRISAGEHICDIVGMRGKLESGDVHHHETAWPGGNP